MNSSSRPGQQLNHLAICEIWREAEDYPKAIGACKKAIKLAKGGEKKKARAVLKGTKFDAKHPQSPELRKTLSSLASDLEAFRGGAVGPGDASHYQTWAKECTNHVNQAKRQGATATSVTDTSQKSLGDSSKPRRDQGSPVYPVEFAKLERVCRQKTMQAKTFPAIDVFATSNRRLEQLKSGRLTFDKDNAGSVMTGATECIQAVDKVMSQGVPGTFMVPVNNSQISLADGRKRLCLGGWC